MTMDSFGRILIPTIVLTVAGVLPGAAQNAPPGNQTGPKYEELVSTGTVTLRVRPVWKDTLLVFEIGADTHSGTSPRSISALPHVSASANGGSIRFGPTGWMAIMARPA